MVKMIIPRDSIDKILTAVEFRELVSIQWGYTDGSLTEEEIQQIAAKVAEQEGIAIPVEELVDAMIRQNLVFERRAEDSTYTYRSRFAEGVRLMSTLKQLFPKKPWISAPGLVSDYRVDARQRAYPRRDIPSVDALSTLAKTPQWSNLQQLLAQALIGFPDFFLSAFQLTAMQQILRKPKTSSGVVVSAGTGSGKTLAFYLPVTLEIGELVQKDEYWVKAVAIYPRIELLKDQFTQMYKFISRADSILKKNGRRPITLGTFFSLTPTYHHIEAVKNAGWTESGSGFVCPFLSCPDCGSELLWLKDDIQRKAERLICRKPECSKVVTSEHLVLTRRDLQQRTPDIVFTTAEMLNQRLSDPNYRHVFGIQKDPKRIVRFVLLDEVHTYEGSSGAQTALAIRRWRHALNSPVRFVGLSATLREATQFFSDFVGLDFGSVVEVKPAVEEYERRSMMYQLILRGNPASQTQLLSSSIQASFLLRRLLDPGRSRDENDYERFGNRLFVFTDDLDVTNRLYDNLRDAEAYNIFGGPDPKRQPLAALRAGLLKDSIPRDRAGQNWRFIESIGHQLEQRLQVSRTTSQDAGVNLNSDVIVATSSLELGFNDPTVGAILQHKSPRKMSAYVQRRGRAGRLTQMRPWMVTVLSDYGRDRVTFQAYEQLFDPILMPNHLPMKNRYILRMQATFAFIDWLSEVTESPTYNIWMWRVLNGPCKNDDKTTENCQRAVIKILDELIKDEGNRLQQLSDHLRGALQLNNREEVASLLWEPPRSLMLEVVPTLFRRLCTQWRFLRNDGSKPKMDIMSRENKAPHPLPDFVPGNLFSELNVPDVSVIIPPATTNHEERIEYRGIVQALSQLVPGRVTRRFAFERGGLHHWVPVPLEAGENRLIISDYAEQYETVAMISLRFEDGVKIVPCFRPWTVRLQKVSEQKVSPTSNGFLNWRSQIITTGEPIKASVDYDAIWGKIILCSEFHLHSFRSPITMRRFALDSTANIRRPRQTEEIRVHTQFTTEDDGLAAIGFEQEVDGLCVRVQLPNAEDLAKRVLNSPNTPAWRAAYFRDCVLDDEVLETITNTFQRDWIHQIYLSALLSISIELNISLPKALEKLKEKGETGTFERVMDCIFRIDPFQEDDSEDGSEDSKTEDKRHSLRERLLGMLQNEEIIERLHNLAAVMWNPDLTLWHNWLVDRLHETLADAVLRACYHLAPGHVGSEGLVIDTQNGLVDSPQDSDKIEIWVTETTLGGAGVIEAIAQEAVAHPRSLLNAIESALAPSDFELVSSRLNMFVRITHNDKEVAENIENLRRQQTREGHDVQFRTLRSLLARRGLSIDQSLSIALHQRILREGTNADSDLLLNDMLDYWKECEKRFGINIDLRVFCYLAILNSSFSERLKKLITVNTSSELNDEEYVATLTGLLWPQPEEQRARSLQGYSQFHSAGWTDATLVNDLLLTTHTQTILFEQPDWRDRLYSALALSGTARLKCRRENEGQLHAEIYRLLAQPIDVDYLQFYPAIDEIKRDEASTTIGLAFKELL